MSELFLDMASEEDMEYAGFFDGQQKPIPDNTELDCVVIDGFNGMEEGKAVQACFVQIAVTTPGEFMGQKYRFNAKIYDMDATKRDRALKNLTVLDTQAGSPLGKGKLPLTTENMQEHWVGASHARVKFGAMIPDDRPDEIINFVRGFGYLRDKLPQQQVKQPEPEAQHAEEDPTVVQTQKKPAKAAEPDIDF